MSAVDQAAATGGARTSGGDRPPLPPYTEELAEGRVVDRLADVALAQPDAIAAADHEKSVTYGDLLRTAVRLGRELSAVNPGNQPVGVLWQQGVDALVAMVGVMASGAPVVVLDPTTPTARLRHYADAGGVQVCVSEARRAESAAEICPTVITPDAEPSPSSPSLAEAAEALRALPVRPTDTVAIVYTSGSTGRPKGVAYDSRLLLHDGWTYSRASDCYGPDDVLANVLPLAFAAGLAMATNGLMVGARQELFDPRARSIAEMPGWLREVGATVLGASPAILRALGAVMPAGERLDTLRVVTMAGETVHSTDLASIRRILGDRCEVRNRYGSTETGMISEFVLRAEDPTPSGATPVGLPVAGMRVQVQDENGICHDRGTGRLVVTSRYLSLGYWKAPEATEKVFADVADGARRYLTSDTATIDDDGVLTLLGRTDHSVKIRGHLVEPGEIDAVLFAQPEIREAVVVGVPSDTGQMRLVAYVVPEGPRLQASSIRRVVRNALPAFMVPQEVIMLPALPRTERGKLDRSALPAPEGPTVGDDVARTDWERVVAAVFARVLELDRVGIHDDFFELGGDSLAAEALMAAMADELGVDPDALSTSLLAEAPTVATFAKVLRRNRRPEHPTLVRFGTSGTRPPLFCVAGAGGVAVAFRSLAQRLGPDQPLMAVQAHGLENRGIPDWSVGATARRHLKTLRSLQPEGPYRLGGHSFGGIVAFEMAHQLRSAGEEVELLVIIDSFPPDPDVQPPVLTGGPLHRLKQIVSLASTGILGDIGLGHYQRFHRQNRVVQKWYRTRPWSGRTLVLVAADDEKAAQRAGWGRFLTGEWAMQQVAGDHLGMLYEPYVAEVARAVAAALDGVDRGRPLTPSGHVDPAG